MTSVFATCAAQLSAATLACGADAVCVAAGQEAFNLCKNPPLSAPAGPGSFGAMFIKDQVPVPFGSDTGGGALVFLPVPRSAHHVAATTRTCADAAVAALGEGNAPDRVYCFQQTTPHGGRAGVYIANCTNTAASVAADGSAVAAYTCPTLLSSTPVNMA